MEEKKANWPAIVTLALETDAKLGRDCTKPGQRLRVIYWTSYRRACELGYRGTEEEWQTFIRVRAQAVESARIELRDAKALQPREEFI